MNSSKLLRRMKPDHSTNLSNFQFLLSSMERERQRQNKQNHQDNHHTNIIKPFFQPKQPTDSPLEAIIYQLKRYLSATDDMLHNPQKVNDKLKKQAISISKQLIVFIKNYEKRKEKQVKSSMLNSTQAPSLIQLGSSKALSSSYHFPNGLLQPEYIKKITDLESEKGQLQSLISQHERANIKMYIKLNEGESQQIETYKRQLSSLFEKYKQLEKVVREQTNTANKLKLQLQAKNVEMKQLQKMVDNKPKKQIHILKERIRQMESIIHEQNSELTSAITKIEELLNLEQHYKCRQKEFKAMVSRLESEKEANKKINNCIQNKQINQTKDEDLYRVLLCQATILDDVLSQ